MRVSPRVLAASNEADLGADQGLLLGILAAVESFFEDAGAPLTSAQVAALRGVEADVRVQVSL